MDLVKLKKQISQKESERDKLIGRRDMFLEELQESGHKTIAKAEIALKNLQNEWDILHKKYKKKAKLLHKKYGNLINA